MTEYFLGDKRRAILKLHLRDLTKEMPDWMAKHFKRLPNDAINSDESAAIEFIQPTIYRRVNWTVAVADRKIIVEKIASLTDEERDAYGAAMTVVLNVYRDEFWDRILNVDVQAMEEPN
jgi:hypothetical protein